MGTTPTYSWPYPEDTDPVANGAQDIEDLALAIESTVSARGKILQVVSTTKTDTFSTASTSFTSITGLTASITPSSASNDVLVFVNLTGLANFAAFANYFQIVRGATAIGIGDAASNRTRATFQMGLAGNNDHVATAAMTHLDAPATTSATTYGVQMRVSSSTGYINRGITDTDSVAYARTVSSITLMEVSS